MADLATYFAAYPVLLAAIAAVLGLVVGSFLNVVIYRLPIMLERNWRQQCSELAGAPAAAPQAGERFDLVFPASRCPHCGHRIGALENIPLFSYMWQRGRCRHCAAAISLRYPVVESITAILSVLIVWRFGYSGMALAALFFVWALIPLTIIDFDHQLLPDDITLLLLWAGLLINVGGVFAPLSAAVIGAAGGYLFLWSVYQLFKLVTGKEGMGFGDFKLFAAFGAWLGWKALPLIILLASLLGAVVGLAFILFLGRDRNVPIPFGPYLCVAALVALLWGDAITQMYLDYARLSR